MKADKTIEILEAESPDRIHGMSRRWSIRCLGGLHKGAELGAVLRSAKAMTYQDTGDTEDT